MDKLSGVAKAAAGTTTAIAGATRILMVSRGEEKEMANDIKETKVGTPTTAIKGLETQAMFLQISTTKFQEWWMQEKASNRL